MSKENIQYMMEQICTLKSPVKVTLYGGWVCSEQVFTRDYALETSSALIIIAREQKNIIALCKDAEEEMLRRADVISIVAELKTRGLTPFPEFIKEPLHHDSIT